MAASTALPPSETPHNAFSDANSLQYHELREDRAGGEQRALPQAERPKNVFSESDAAKYHRRLTQRDWVATCFAGALLLIISIVVISVLSQWTLSPPTLSNMPIADQKEAVERYKELSGVLTDRIEKFFDLTVTKALLPIFATIVGFLLGKRTGKEME